MAKQQSKPITPSAKKQATPPNGGSFSYLWRNFAVLAVIGIVFLTINNVNEGPAKMQTLYREYMQLRQSGKGNPAEMNALADEFKELSADTGSIKEGIRKYTRGYYWAIHDIAIGGMKEAQEREEAAGKELTREDKLATRVSIWPLIQYINKNTPPNAVIYLPAGDAQVSNNGNWNYVYDPEWMEYFLYPRLCVAMGAESQHPDLAKRVTHVVIIEGKGYDKLKYDVPEGQRPREAVLPIDHPPAVEQTKQ